MERTIFLWTFMIIKSFGPWAEGQYEWSHDKLFDCVVAIVNANKEHICTGVLVTKRLVLTALNPVERYLNTPEKLKIYGVGKTEFKVECIMPQVDRTLERNTWVRSSFSSDFKYSTAHDMAIIKIAQNDRRITTEPGQGPVTNETKPPERLPYPAQVALLNFTFAPNRFRVGGFGMYGRLDVRDSKLLLDLSYNAEVYFECDELLPSKWGAFLCILDVDKLVDLASGSPLFQSAYDNSVGGFSIRVFGIGSFLLNKGKDDVLIFTDVREYAERKLSYCFKKKDNDNHLPWPKDYYTYNGTEETIYEAFEVQGSGYKKVDIP